MASLMKALVASVSEAGDEDVLPMLKKLRERKRLEERGGYRGRVVLILREIESILSNSE